MSFITIHFGGKLKYSSLFSVLKIYYRISILLSLQMTRSYYSICSVRVLYCTKTSNFDVVANKKVHHELYAKQKLLSLIVISVSTKIIASFPEDEH